MQRAALYARVSTSLQEKEQTIQSQLAAIARYADHNQLRHTPALTYTDDGYSGSWLDRPALDELRDHAREGRFDVVVVLCPDRLARRYAYQVLLLDELKRAGIEVQFCERPINDSPDDQLLLQIQGAIAEYERAKILERCRRGRLHRARRGELAPPRTPYGYVYSARKYGGDGQIRIDDDEAAMVRQVFEWYAQGKSVYHIQERLNASTWKPRHGKCGWGSSLMLRILRCEWYVGRAYYNRTKQRPPDRPSDPTGKTPAKPVWVERPRSEWITVPVPRIVDDELFARAQQRIEDNKRFSKRRLKRPGVYLMKGLLKCGLCGYAYTGLTRFATPKNWGQSEYRYYTCTKYGQRRRDLPGTAGCKNGRLDVQGVDHVVWTTVRDLLLNSDALAEQLGAWLERTTADATGEERLRLTTTRLEELNRQRERLIDAYQTGALGLEDFQPRKSAIEERTLGVEQERAELQSWASKQELAARQVESAAAVVEQLRARLPEADFETRQAVLRLVVEKVVITGRRLEIHLALPVSGLFHLTSRRGAKLF